MGDARDRRPPCSRPRCRSASVSAGGLGCTDSCQSSDVICFPASTVMKTRASHPSGLSASICAVVRASHRRRPMNPCSTQNLTPCVIFLQLAADALRQLRAPDLGSDGGSLKSGSLPRALGRARAASRSERSGCGRLPNLLEVELANETVSWLADREKHAVDDRSRGEVAVCLSGPVLNEVRRKQ